MQLGPKGEALIKSYEKLRLAAYQDEGGVWTVGWGHTGPEVVEGILWTPEQAETAFRTDTGAAVAEMNRAIRIPVTQNQFDALVCFAFNVGCTAAANSTLMRLLNIGCPHQAAEQFARWDKVRGRPSAGLSARRAAEAALFLSPP